MGNYGLFILVLLGILGKYNVEANSFEPQLVENGQNVLKVKQEDYVYGTIYILLLQQLLQQRNLLLSLWILLQLQ